MFIGNVHTLDMKVYLVCDVMIKMIVMFGREVLFSEEKCEIYVIYKEFFNSESSYFE